MKKFKPIPLKGYIGYFWTPVFPEVAVSPSGLVMRLKDAHDKKNTIAGEPFGRRGDVSQGSLSVIRYRFIRTYSEERQQRQKVYVHRIVAYALLGPPPEGKMLVNHKDYNRSNNAVDNLEWTSVQENTLHGVSTNNPAMEMYAYLYW